MTYRVAVWPLFASPLENPLGPGFDLLVEYADSHSPHQSIAFRLLVPTVSSNQQSAPVVKASSCPLQTQHSSTQECLPLLRMAWVSAYNLFSVQEATGRQQHRRKANIPDFCCCCPPLERRNPHASREAPARVPYPGCWLHLAFEGVPAVHRRLQSSRYGRVTPWCTDTTSTAAAPAPALHNPSGHQPTSLQVPQTGWSMWQSASHPSTAIWSRKSR